MATCKQSQNQGGSKFNCLNYILLYAERQTPLNPDEIDIEIGKRCHTCFSKQADIGALVTWCCGSTITFAHYLTYSSQISNDVIPCLSEIQPRNQTVYILIYLLLQCHAELQ